MDTLDAVLLNMGCNLATSTLYDILKKIFQSSPELTKREFKKKLEEGLVIRGVEKIAADELIEFLARSGDIKISGTKILAGSILYQSFKGKTIELAPGIVSETEQTFITTGQGEIKVSNQAFVRQVDGKITFSA